jgi:ABC-type branched-subunit amino acid transport system permease subunit
MIEQTALERATPPLSLPPVPSAPRAQKRWLGRIFVWSSVLLLVIPPLAFAEDSYRLGLFAKYLALAILALGADLVWGYTGMLSLGQGLYFAIGAYCVALSLEMQQVAAKEHAVPGAIPPGFMNYTNLPVTHPDYAPPKALSFIAPLANIWVALGAAVVFSACLRFD